MIARRMAFWIVGALVMAAAPAQAYVPPSEFLVKSIVGKHAGIKGLRARSLVTAWEGGKPGSAHFKVISIFDPKTHALRSFALDDQDQKLFAVERRDNVMPIGALMVFGTNLPTVIRQLKDEKVPVKTDEELLLLADENERRAAEVSTFRRWKNTMAWVIGKPAAPGQSGDPQLWVEKDSFLPLRLITKQEVQYESFRFNYGFPFPKVTVLLGSSGPEDIVLKDEMVEVVIGPMVSEFKAPLTPGFTEKGNDAPSDVRRLIDTYFQFLR